MTAAEFQAIRFEQGAAHVIDQTLLPQVEVNIPVRSALEAADAIKTMKVRGAPAIAIVAVIGLAVECRGKAAAFPQATEEQVKAEVSGQIRLLRAARPTAVDLFNLLNAVEERFLHPLPASRQAPLSFSSLARDLSAFAGECLENNRSQCQRIAEAGASLFPAGKAYRILTHCNTGSLATAGTGTALGVIKEMHRLGRLEMVWVDETRPYLQGSRLTAFELGKSGIPFRIIVDGAAASVMASNSVDAVIVGADRITSRGDFANKIGTLGVAVLAAHFRVPFYVAAPESTFDLGMQAGAAIPIELRDELEILAYQGHAAAPVGARAHNPSFDVTPAELVKAIVTDRGIMEQPLHSSIASHFLGHPH